MSELIPAYILHSRKYGDSSAILDCFTQTQGRVGVIAKGGLADKKRQSLIQPFIPLLINWRGKGELPTLTHVEAADNGFRLQGKHLYCGIYINELLTYLTAKHDPSLNLFAEYCLALEELSACSDMDQILRRFEVQLLKLTGNIGSFDRQHDGEAVEQGQRYQYRKGFGINQVMDKSPSSVTGQVLIALERHALVDENLKKQAKHFMRHVLAQHLGGRTLKSRELFQEVVK